MKKFYALPAALLALVSLNAIAEEQPPLYSIDGVVVTATGTQRRLVDSPAPISVITESELASANVANISDALVMLSPSFAVHTSGMGTTLSFNGLEEDYYVFLENGRRLDGEDPFERIDMSKVKRIEILSGASAALYGTNAIGGVINIITSRSEEDVNIESYTRYGSKNRLTESINIDLNIGRLNSATTYTFQSADSWQLSPYEEDGDELVASDHVASAGFTRNNVAQKFEYQVSDKLTISANGGYFNSLTDRPQGDDFSYTYNILHENISYGATATYQLNPNSTLMADFYGENYISYDDYFTDSKSFSTGDMDLNKHTTYQNVHLRGIFDLSENNLLTAGLEYSNNGLDDGDVDGVHTDTYAVFAQDELKIAKNLTAVIGARYTYQDAFDGHLSPNASLMYKIGSFNLRGTYAAGFRAPTLEELYAQRNESSKSISYSNSELNPETSSYTSFSVEYNSNWLSLSVTGFYNGINDMIEYQALGYDEEDEDGDYLPVQQKQNFEKAEIWGVIASVNARFGAGFSVGAAYTALDPRNISGDCPIDKSVRNSLTANVQWTHDWNNYGLNVSLNGRVNGERYYAYEDGYAPKYQLWDLNTRHSFEFSSLYLEPGIGIENIFNYVDDRPYCSNYATLSPGRSLYVSLTVRFKN